MKGDGPDFVPTLTFICHSDGGAAGICWLHPLAFDAGVSLSFSLARCLFFTGNRPI